MDLVGCTGVEVALPGKHCVDRRHQVAGDGTLEDQSVGACHHGRINNPKAPAMASGPRIGIYDRAAYEALTVAALATFLSPRRWYRNVGMSPIEKDSQ